MSRFDSGPHLQRWLPARDPERYRCWHPSRQSPDSFPRHVQAVGVPQPRSACSTPCKKDLPLNNRFVLISGCSGGGKSTLLTELRGRGYPVVEDPAAASSPMTEWRPAAARCPGPMRPPSCAAPSTSRSRIWRWPKPAPAGWFFDRGLVDAASALASVDGRTWCCTRSVPSIATTGVPFVTPPSAEIYVTDSERRHGFEAATAEYRRLRRRPSPCSAYDAVVTAARARHPRGPISCWRCFWRRQRIDGGLIILAARMTFRR